MKKLNFAALVTRFRSLNRRTYWGIAGVLAVIVLLWASCFFFGGNRQADLATAQVTRLADNIRQYYQNRPDGWGISTEALLRNKIVPADMQQEQQIVNALGKNVLVGADENGNVVMPGMRSFAIVYQNLNKEECRIVAEKSLTESLQLAVNSIVIDNGTNKTEFIWGGENPLPITKSGAAKACQNNNIVVWNINL